MSLKLKTKEFHSLTRSMTSDDLVPTSGVLKDTALGLCGRVDLAPQQLYRLVGVGLSKFNLDNEEKGRPKRCASIGSAADPPAVQGTVAVLDE